MAMNYVNEDEQNEEQTHLRGKSPAVKKLRRSLGFRHFQVFLLFLCLTIYYIMRVNLSMAIVVMTDRSNTKHGHLVFDWSSKERGLLLSAFFWGYPFSNLFAGILVTKFSIKTLLMISCLYNAAATTLTPWLVSWGLHVGVILAFSFSGLLGSSPGGWPSIFYLSGALAFAWSILFYKYGANTPDQCRYVSNEEKDLIKAELPRNSATKKNIPWRKVLVNKSVWAICIAHTGQNWGYWICVSLMPTYLAHALHFDIGNNGLTSAMPFFVLWIVSFPASFASDYLIKFKIRSTGTVRKLNNTIGHVGSALALVCLALSATNAWAISWYTVCVACNAFAFVGYNANPLDISPNFAGLISGLSNFLSNSSSILAPIFVGHVVTDPSDVSLWKIVFYSSAGVYVIGNTLYVILGSGKVQDFDKIDDIEMESQPVD